MQSWTFQPWQVSYLCMEAWDCLNLNQSVEFRPPTMYYTTIPLVSERTNNRRWDAAKLRELRKRLDSGPMGTEEIDQVATDFTDSEIVDLASDWLGNTVSWMLCVGKLCTDLSIGCTEVVRKVFLCTSLCDAGTSSPAFGHDRHPQKWYMGCPKDYRMCFCP